MWRRRPRRQSSEKRTDIFKKHITSTLPLGPSREAIEQQIRRASTDKEVRDWLASRELRPPK